MHDNTKEVNEILCSDCFIKKEVIDSLKTKLAWDLVNIQVELRHNKDEIKRLSEKQRLLKGQRHEIGGLIHYLNTRK